MASSTPSRMVRRPLSPIYSPPRTPSPQLVESKASLEQVRRLLRQILRITVLDGRIFIGTFAGTDKPLNLILINAEEFRLGAGQNTGGRYVGQIMIPWKQVVKAEANIPETPKSLDSSMYMWQVGKR